MGELERVYIEQDGQLSIFIFTDKRAGLPIVPPWDLKQPFLYNGQDLMRD